MRSAPPIGFEYRPSRSLAWIAALLIALAMSAIVMSGVVLSLKFALVACMIGYGAPALWRYLHPRLRALNWRADGSVSITLIDRKGLQSEVQGVLHGARVMGPLIALQLRWRRGRAGLWLLPDVLDADTRRRLRMRLALDGARAGKDGAVCR